MIGGALSDGSDRQNTPFYNGFPLSENIYKLEGLTFLHHKKPTLLLLLGNLALLDINQHPLYFGASLECNRY